MNGPAELYWNERRVASVKDARWDDFPWATGRLESFSATTDLREALEWLARMAEADELEDPPFDASLLEGWRLRSADGHEREVSPPLIDFEANTATWC